MIITTIGDLIKSLKTYPESSHGETVGIMWYRRKFFRDDVEKKKFLTDDIFAEALSQVNDEYADEKVSEQIIGCLQDLEQYERDDK
jgi:UDP-N-acetylglucosamine 2-epimerase